MNDADRTEIAALINKVLDDRRENDPAIAKRDQFIADQMAEKEQRDKRWERIKTQIIGWAAISGLAFMGKLVLVIGAWSYDHVDDLWRQLRAAFSHS